MVKSRHGVNQVVPIGVGNDDYIILFNFWWPYHEWFCGYRGGGGGAELRKQNKAGLIRVKCPIKRPFLLS